MQTSAFGKSKDLWATLTEGSWSEAYTGFGASLVLVTNPAIQVPKTFALTFHIAICVFVLILIFMILCGSF